jgi:hypothetical protein
MQIMDLQIYPGYVNGNYLYNSDGSTGTPYNGIRQVVTLDSKAQLKDSGTNKNGCKLYNMTVNE